MELLLLLLLIHVLDCCELTTLNQNVKYSMFNLLQVHQAWRWKHRWATSSNLICKQQHIKVSLKGGARCVIGIVRVFMWSFWLYMFVAGYVGKKLRTASAILFISIIPRIIISRPLPAKSSHRYCTVQFPEYEASYCTVNVTWSNIIVCPFERIQLLFWMKISRLRHPVTLRRSQSHLRLVCTLLNMHTMATYLSLDLKSGGSIVCIKLTYKVFLFVSQVIGSVLYFTTFSVDKLGQPLLDENPQLTDGWEVPTYL